MRRTGYESPNSLDAGLDLTEPIALRNSLPPPPQPPRTDPEPAAEEDKHSGTAAPPWQFGDLISPWLTSLIIHMTIFLAMAWVIVETPHITSSSWLNATRYEAENSAAELDQAGSASSDEIGDFALEPEAVTSPSPVDLPSPSSDLAGPQSPLESTLGNTGLGLTRSDWMLPVAKRGGGLDGRSRGARGQLLAARGGTARSEEAVELALRWLAAHQLEDGSWRFDLTHAPKCRGSCRDSGTVGSTTAATALGVLPFLGAGYTHREGNYQEVVQRALYYLASRAVITPEGADLQEGTMYAQGLATIALCEAYAMTRDETLAGLAQSAIDFIVRAQHSAGGWRYSPGEPGDTTSFGWQLMALKSGELAGLRVPSPTLYSASSFLDSVQTDGGAAYGYQAPKHKRTTTAIGLLCRMYLGWGRKNKALERGVAYLDRRGPSGTCLYFNYYATQVLYHYDGPAWHRWNVKMRDHLLKTQANSGHEQGSWNFDDAPTNSAGRLYNTAMATLILEVYYRHLPLFSPDLLSNAGGEFPAGE